MHRACMGVSPYLCDLGARCCDKLQRLPYFLGNQWPAVLPSWRVKVDSRITGGSVGIVDYAIGEKRSARPSHPGVMAVFREVEQCRLAREER